MEISHFDDLAEFYPVIASRLSIRPGHLNPFARSYVQKPFVLKWIDMSTWFTLLATSYNSLNSLTITTPLLWSEKTRRLIDLLMCVHHFLNKHTDISHLHWNNPQKIRPSISCSNVAVFANHGVSHSKKSSGWKNLNFNQYSSAPSNHIQFNPTEPTLHSILAVL